MTLTIGLWIVPLLLTIGFCVMMFRPYQPQGYYDFGGLLRPFWLIPILLSWLIYFAIEAFSR